MRAMHQLLKVIGLMSGTSLDGIDAAIVDTDGEARVISGPSLAIVYGERFRAELRGALDFAAQTRHPANLHNDLAQTARRLTGLHAQAVLDLIDNAGLTPADIDLVGFHGQTVLHRPEVGITVQIGEGDWLAREIGIPVASNFRAHDVAAGGQGAPLAPAYHRAMVGALKPDKNGPVVVVNIGGVANVTWVAPDQPPLAFDTGPGGALLDDWVRLHTGNRFDEGGALAASGKVDEARLARLLDNDYFARPPPKSLDRNAFSARAIAGLNVEDGAATLVAFTAASIGLAAKHFPESPARWIIVGGGRHNAAMLRALAARVEAPVMVGEDVGWQGDMVEAQAFAYLAVRAKLNLPITWPQTTGVSCPLTGGILHEV
ncbi:MAG: anhydro-N-acetylmuramic acid kinase [Alphaproteobacteria bacterium]